MTMSRVFAALAATTMLITLAASCGDDDAESAVATSPATAAAETAAPETQPSSDDTAVCTPYIDVTLAFNGLSLIRPTLVPMLDQIDATAPTEIANELATMVAAARTVIESEGQDFAAFEAPEFAAAEGVVDPWMFEHCPFAETAEITASEYKFEGFGDELAAGPGRRPPDERRERAARAHTDAEERRRRRVMGRAARTAGGASHDQGHRGRRDVRSPRRDRAD